MGLKYCKVALSLHNPNRKFLQTNFPTIWTPTLLGSHAAQIGASNDQEKALKDIAAELLTRTVKQLDEALNDGSLTEICDDHKI